MRKVSIIVFGLAIGAAAAAFVLQRPIQEANEKPTVVSTAYPVEFLVSYIGGDHVSSSLLVPAGTEPHDFEPTFQDAVAMRDADLLLTVGEGFDAWADDAVADRDGKPTVVAFDQLPEERVIEGDPHFWLDASLYAELVDPVTEALVELSPDAENEMRSRADELKRELDGIHSEYMALGFLSCHQEFVVLHDAFSYIPFVTLHPVSGVTPEEEPSLARLAELADFIEEHHISVIFTEPLVDPAFVDTLATETGARVSVLDPIEGLTSRDESAGTANYLSLVEYNLQQLRSATVCE